MPAEPYDTTLRCEENLFLFSNLNKRYVEGFRHPDIPGLTIVCTTNGHTRSTILEVYYCTSQAVMEPQGSRKIDRTIHLFSSLPILIEGEDTEHYVPSTNVEVQDEMLRHVFLSALLTLRDAPGEPPLSDSSRAAWRSLIDDRDVVIRRFTGHVSLPAEDTDQHRVGWIERVRDDRGNETWTKRTATKNEAGDWTWTDEPSLVPPKSTKPFDEIEKLF